MGTPCPTVPTPPPSSVRSASCSSIVKQKRVSLYNWWLETTSNGTRLSVGGHIYKEGLGVRTFQSAAIVKRHDTVTLETEDGIRVNIIGSISRSQTVQNGLSPEVCNHFLIGFPFDWEEFSNPPFAKESINRAIPRRLSNLDGIESSSVDGINSFHPKSFDNLPGALLRDFSASIVGGSATHGLWRSMFEDILQKYGGTANHGGLFSVNMKKDPVMTRKSTEEGTPSKHRKSMVDPEDKGKDDISVTESGRKMFQKITPDKGMLFNSHSVRQGPLTRSMTRTKSSANKQDLTHLAMNTGRTDSNLTQITRKLKLRNRSVELHLTGYECAKCLMPR